MSDFLSNLALRSLQPATTPALLQPRLPSLFEAPGGPDQIVVPPAESETEKQASPRETAVESALPPRTEKSKAAPISVEPQRTLLYRLEPEVPLHPRPVTKEVIRPLPQPNEGTPQAELTSVNEMKAANGPASVEGSRPAVAENAPSQRVLHPRVELIPASPKEKLTPALPVTTSALRPLSAEPEMPAERAPIIQIRIGRIEVRAVTPAPVSPARAVRQSPKLTLDDYLRQRNEGQR